MEEKKKKGKKKCQNSISVISFIRPRCWSRIYYEVKEWSRFCSHLHCALSARLRLFCDTVLNRCQKEGGIKWPYSMKGDIEKQINSRPPEAKEKCCHWCKLSQVQCASSSIGQMEGVPFSKYKCLSHTHGNIPFLMLYKRIDHE